MRRPLLLVVIALVGLACVTPLRGAEPATAPASPPFEKSILAFEKSDREHPPEQNANLFIGSSSFARWKTLAADFPGVPVINRGFGGSRIADCTRNVGRIVLPYHPRRIFFYAGDNDLAAKRTPEQVLADFKAFVEAVRAGDAHVPIYFISIKPSPKRIALIDKMREANKLIEAYTHEGAELHYVDVFTLMLGSDGLPRAELFGADKLHMVHAGYEIWIARIAPLMK